MPKDALTPLRFAPIFRPAIWGGSRLRALFGQPASTELIGEAWILSDYGESHSVVADGKWAGETLRKLIEQYSARLVGSARMLNGRLPILLKFIHAQQPLSVQVHPDDRLARKLEGPNATGKSEAWVVQEADPIARLYTGLLPGTTAEQWRSALDAGKAADLLFALAPMAGDCVFLPAGTVHAIGAGVVLFEIQQTSDITYRLFDWGRPRELQIEKGLRCVDYSVGPARPSYPTDEGRGRVRMNVLVDCEHFRLGRWDSDQPFRAGAAGECRILVGSAGKAIVRHAGVEYPITVGDVLMLPADVGACDCIPQGEAIILECVLPE